MPDADPLGGDDPYKKLGVSEQMTVDRIKVARDDLVSKYKDEVRRAKQNDDNDLYRDAQNALREIDDAWDWVQKNHEPPGIDKEVSISAGSEDAHVGETVTFEVASKDGPEGDVPVTADDPSLQDEQTADDGTMDYTFDDVGTVTVTARTTSDHPDAATTVTVHRRPVTMTFGSAPDEVEVGELATFEITDSTGTAIDGVELYADGERLGTTDASGTASVTFGDVGSLQVTATKADDDVTTYADATTGLTVREEEVPLHVTVRPNDATVGEAATVVVHEADGTRVKDAHVSVDGSTAGRTTADGTARIDLPLSIPVEIAANKSAAPGENRVYERVTEQFRPNKRQSKLRIECEGDEWMEGEELDLRVVDEEGRSVEGAEVSADDYSGRTDAQGEESVPLTDNGELTVTVTKSSSHTEYESAVETIKVEEFTRQLRFDELPDTASPGNEVRIRITDQQGTVVEDVEIRSSRQFKSWYTNADGVARVTLRDDVGLVRITAEKNDSNTAEDDNEFSDAAITDTIHVVE